MSERGRGAGLDWSATEFLIDPIRSAIVKKMKVKNKRQKSGVSAYIEKVQDEKSTGNAREQLDGLQT